MSSIRGHRMASFAAVFLILPLAACSCRGSHAPSKTYSPTPTANSSPARTPTSTPTIAATTPAPSTGTAPASAKAPTPAWIREFGSPTLDHGNAIGIDRQGNLIVGGATQGPLPGRTLGGTWDAYLRKYSPSGAEIWTVQFTNSLSVGVLTLAVDGSNNIIAAGHVVGALAGQTRSGGDYGDDAWVGKYSPEGKALWTRQVGSTADDWGFAVAVDASGNIVLAGGAEGALPGQTSSGQEDAYVVKFSPNGDQLWTRQFGGPDIDRATGVAVDSDGNIILAGRTQGAPIGDATSGERVDWVQNPTPPETRPGQMPPGKSETFVRKYTPDGVELWTIRFSSGEITEATAVGVDKRGNIFVAGRTRGAMPGMERMGYEDAFVKKLTPAGAEIWTREFGSSIYAGATSVAVDASGDVLVAGHVMSALPGQERAGLDDAFLRKYSSAGDEMWTAQFGSPGQDAATGVATDSAGNIVVVGETYDVLPGQIYAGQGDAYVLLFNWPPT